jgi:hypothetical protein
MEPVGPIAITRLLRLVRSRREMSRRSRGASERRQSSLTVLRGTINARDMELTMSEKCAGDVVDQFPLLRHYRVREEIMAGVSLDTRRGQPLKALLSQLGLLIDLAGTRARDGSNLISLLDFDSNPPSTGPNDSRLKINATGDLFTYFDRWHCP